MDHTMPQKAQRALEIVEAWNSEKMMRALAALLKSQSDSDGYVSFPRFYKMLLEEERVAEIRRPVVYGLLSALEREGYIDVDRAGYRHRYKADRSTVRRAMQRLLSKAATRRENVSKELAAELMKLRERRDDIGRYSSMVAASITRGTAASEIQFATNAAEVQELIRKKIHNRARRGDIVRVHFFELEQEILTYAGTHLEPLLRKGSLVRILLHATVSREARIAISDFLRSQMRYVNNQSLVVRVRTRADLTYEFVGLNDMAIVLAVATSPPMATYIPRHADERLVTHTITTFDREFERAVGLDEQWAEEDT